MRLWSLHPKYLDKKGLSGLWREALIAQDCIIYKSGRYYNYPQLERFKIAEFPHGSIYNYLCYIFQEGLNRGYDFNFKRINADKLYGYSKLVSSQKNQVTIYNFKENHWIIKEEYRLNVTKSQLKYEFLHLQRKLETRKKEQRKKNFEDAFLNGLEANPLFKITQGEIEKWERINSNPVKESV